jgi:hypothetical protein
MDADFALFGVIIAGFCLCGLLFGAQYSQWRHLGQADRRQSSLRASATLRQSGRNESRGNDA